MVSRTKGAFSQDLLPIKINSLLKQMGQTHVNKLFKLLLNSQGVPFKSSTRLPDLVFNYSRVQKELKGRNCVNVREMVSLMALVTILLKSSLFCLFLLLIRF